MVPPTGPGPGYPPDRLAETQGPTGVPPLGFLAGFLGKCRATALRSLHGLRRFVF